jgi:ribosomal-protein-alanine N-acetyltransferase
MLAGPGNTVNIRLFEPADIPQITELEHSVYGSGAYLGHFFRQLHDLFPTLLWVAEQGGRLVGHVCGAMAQDGQTGWILNFAVQAHFRRQGIGEQLLQRGVEQLQLAGARSIMTTSEPDNGPALRLLNKLGFEEIGLAEDYYGEGDDRRLLVRPVE